MSFQTKIPWFNSSFNLSSLSTVNEKKRLRFEKFESNEAADHSNLEQDLVNLFINKYHPKQKFDLIVNSRKILEVEQWFDYIFKHRPKESQFFLFVLGPSGSGKTTTVKIIAKERDIEIREYQEPTFINNIFYCDDLSIDSLEKQSNHSYFFSNQSQIINMKNFCWNVNKPALFENESKNRVLLIKDFPSTFFTDPDQFYKLFFNYYRHFHLTGAPVIFIITINSRKDQTISKFFKSKWRESLQVKEIWFNPFTKRCISQFLSNIAESKVSKEEIDSIAENSEGDIRYAFNLFELRHRYSLHEKSFQTKKRKTETGKKIQNMDSRDFSITFYHFLGKILYGKRLFDQPKEVLLPHLSTFERYPLKESPSSLISLYEISSDTLIFYLLQNYLEFSNDVDCISASIDWLSFADCLIDREDFGPDSTLNIYKKFISVAGLMFDLNPSLETLSKCPKTHFSKMIEIKGPKWFKNFKKILNNQTVLSQEMDKDCHHSSNDLITDLLPYSFLMKKLPFFNRNYNIQVLKTFSDFSDHQNNFESYFAQSSNTSIEKDNVNKSLLDSNLKLPTSYENSDEEDYTIEEV